MSFPPAHMLVGAGLGEVAASAGGLSRPRAWLLASLCAVLPDADFLVGVALGRGAGAHHGTFSHSILATVVAGLLVAAAAGWRWGGVAAAGYGSHLLVDLLDDRGRTNVQLAWPFSRAQAVAIDSVFPRVPIVTGQGKRAAARSLLTPEVVEQLAAQTAIGAVFAALLFGAAWLLRRGQGAA